MIERNAPYNEEVIPDRTFEVEVNVTLEKKCEITTDDYYIERDEFGHHFANTLSTDWERAYNESHFTIPELLQELQYYVEKEMCVTDEHSRRGRELKRIYNDLQDWEVVETNYEY